MSLNWQAYWQSRPAPADPSLDDLLVQVSKTRFGTPVGVSQVQLLTEHITSRLPVRATSRALDLGCGNGLITARLASRLALVVALDYSQPLLDTARRFHAPDNVRYVSADLRDLTDLDLAGAPFDVAWSVEVIQNLDPVSLRTLLRWLTTVTTREFVFLASGVPDRERIRNFYDTPERWQRHLENDAAGNEQMGRWWLAEEVHDAARDVGLVAEIGSLPSCYYTSDYRFDVLFRAA